jgi:2-hydroxychromene-2-carboxylate isomerase
MSREEGNKLRFLFDYISPYAYLAWTQIHSLAARHGRRVEPVPILFAALLNTYGHKGPAEIPPKRTYIFKDALRLAHRFGVPLIPPPSHPFNPLLPLRVSSVPVDSEAHQKLVDGLFRAVWGGGGGATTPEQIAAVATDAGLDGPRLVAEAETQETKALLRRRTDEAISAGAFGVPTILADGELFWGVDSLAHLDVFLRGEDPLNPDLVGRWERTLASASRAR